MSHLEDLAAYIVAALDKDREFVAHFTLLDQNGERVEWGGVDKERGLRLVAHLDEQTLFASLDLRPAVSAVVQRHGLTTDCAGHHQFYRRGEISTVHAIDIADEIGVFADDFVRDSAAAFADLASGGAK